MATIKENAVWCGYHTLAEKSAYCEGAKWVLEEIENLMPKTPCANPNEVIDIIAYKIKELKDE